ncbi:NfeD family protein [Alteromonas sp. ASW11-36]|uniref:NfeD family protein n=1 Tax=Alteromonas arenosi TaxID=3055817 RepID=A0ABT7T0P4_9ALTE|nr:NfeD family protein [Alteromonas sp. ASW11-36]MDM7862011.1 NfeD family protein [Alteromonas sp. ASW11-36]
MDTMLNNMPHFLLGIGIALLIVEILLGFTTILLFTLGISFILTSGLMYFGIIDEQMLDAFIAVAVLDTIFTALLWRPMRKLQKNVDSTPVTSDLVGMTFNLESDVAPGIDGETRYSGITWKVKSAQSLKAGTEVKVVRVEVGVLFVE